MSAKEQISARTKNFRRRSIAFAMASGACYGLYTTCLTLAQTQGTWPQWPAGHAWAEMCIRDSIEGDALLAEIADGVRRGRTNLIANGHEAQGLSLIHISSKPRSMAPPPVSRMP